MTKQDAGERTSLDGSGAAIVAICSLAYLLDGLVHTLLGPLAPAIAKDLSLSNAQLGPIFSANLIGQCIGLILFPLASARTGHRRVVVMTAFGFGLFQLLSGFAQGGAQLFALRLATGFFLGGALPSCLAMVTAAAPPHRRGLLITVLFTGYGIGSTLAGLMSTLFVFGGWRGAMAIVGATCLAVAVIAWRWLAEVPEARGGGPASAPAGGALRLAVALLGRRYIVGTIGLWVLFISMLTISYCLMSWLPTLMIQVGRDPALASYSVSIFGIGGIVAALGVGVLIDRFGPTRVLVSFLVIASGLLFLIGQALATAPTPVLMALLVLAGFFGLGAYGGINVVLAGFYPSHLRALGIGLTKSVGRVGSVLAPILIGLALSAGAREVTVMSLFAAPAMLAALALLVIGSARRSMSEQAQPQHAVAA